MAQARVTDFFAQSKRSAVDRALRGKDSQKAAVETVLPQVEVFRENARATRSRSKITSATRSTRTSKAVRYERNGANGNAEAPPERSEHPSEIFEDLPTKAEWVPERAERVPEKAEAVTQTVETDHVSPVSVSPVKQKEQIQSPRTPKRTSTEAEFDLGADIFPNTTGHSSAKKRVRLRPNQDGDVPPKTQQKTARKKLVLSNEDPVSTGQVSSAQPDEKESKGLVKSNTALPFVDKLPPKNNAESALSVKKTFSRDDVSALKARLEKIRGQKQTCPRPVCPPKDLSSDTKAILARARKLGARVQTRKEDRNAIKEAQPVEAEQSRENVPAYQRYHTLAQDVPPGLSLPYKYKVLAEMFRSMDTIVGMLFNRSETVTFAKVKQGVQEMMHKRFEESHMGQIKTVYPSAYTFRQEKNVPTFNATAKTGYQLTMEPVLDTDKTGAHPHLPASRLLERRHVFHRNLVAIVKQHHKAFLASLDPAMAVPDDKLTRWHPRFRVDEVPDVPTSSLPQPPNTDRLTTAQEVLEKARNLMTPKMEKALANMALKTAESAVVKEQDVTPKPLPSAANTPSALRGVSQALLERIRAKEAQKLQAAMTRNPQQEERLLMMSRLAEVARILRNVFVAEKKPALVMDLVCSRVTASYRSTLSNGEMEKHLRLLAQLAPEWLTVHPIRKDFYVKLDKTLDLNVVLEKLSQKIKEEEKL